MTSKGIVLKMLVFTVSFTLFVQEVAPANILLLNFFSSRSHKMTYTPLLEELATRGHNVTVVSPFKPTSKLPNIREIFTIDIEQLILQENVDVFSMKEKGGDFDRKRLAALVYQVCEKTLDLPQIKNILTPQKEKFDLILLQPFFNDCALGLIHKLQAPFIMITTLVAPGFYVELLGGHYPTAVVPNTFSGFSPLGMSFTERFMNFGMTMVLNIYFTLIYIPQVNNIVRERLGEDIPCALDIARNTSMILSNSHVSLSGPVPLFPDVVEIGGLHSREGKPLPMDIEEFVTSGGNNEGFILFSMGSAIRGDMMPEAKRLMILRVFSRLKQQVLWKWESESMPGDLPRNVKLSKWLPQQDLLARKDIRIFITHCGGSSTEESLYHGVPLLGLPMMTDQPRNAELGMKHGMLIKLDWNTMDEGSFEGAILELLNNSTYRENARKISDVFKDRPVHPVQLASYWVEYVLRHNGAPHLRNAGRKMNFIQYHSIDVMLAYVVIIAISTYLIFILLRCVIRMLFCRNLNRKGISNVSVEKKRS